MKNSKPFFVRFLTYQKERFPFLVHGPLIAAFSFSAIGYSRLCRGETSFIPAIDYLHCICITITLFFLLRLSDEHKDKEDDAKYRTYLPVPRGLVSLKELAVLGVIIFLAQVLLVVILKLSLIYLYALVIIYLILMGVEFFIKSWLKTHLFWYVVSHMFIMPLIDIYASGYDWKLNNVPAPNGLFFFFAVSYCNGIVIEIGRKIKTPETEEPNVNNYTALLGTRKAVGLWLVVLVATYIISLFAAIYANHGTLEFVILTVLLFIAAIPAMLFYKNIHSVTLAKYIEYASVLWTFGMYLSLGGIPMLIQLFKS